MISHQNVLYHRTYQNHSNCYDRKFHGSFLDNNFHSHRYPTIFFFRTTLGSFHLRRENQGNHVIVQTKVTSRTTHRTLNFPSLHRTTGYRTSDRDFRSQVRPKRWWLLPIRFSSLFLLSTMQKKKTTKMFVQFCEFEKKAVLVKQTGVK